MIVNLQYAMKDLDYVFSLSWDLSVGMDTTLFNTLWDSLHASFGETVSSRNEICGRFPVYGDLDHVIQTSEVLSKILRDGGLEVRPKNGPLDVRMLKNHAWRLSSYPAAWSANLQKMMVAENLHASTGGYDLKTTNHGTLYYVRSVGDKVYLNPRVDVRVYCEARRETSRSSWDAVRGVIEDRIRDPLRMPSWAMGMIRSTNESGVGDSSITRHHDVVPP